MGEVLILIFEILKRKTKKFSSRLVKSLKEYSSWFFCDASTNQIRISKLKKGKFTSYTQLKKYQKRLKRTGVTIFLILLSLFAGMFLVLGIFPENIKSELYIPNGRGDIILGNISKNQATVIFKTLDSANDNKPLATKAFVEVFSDENYTNMVRQSAEADYAVTHIIQVDSLQEGLVYYVRITAKDSSEKVNIESVTSWGDGKDPIKFLTVGDFISACEQQTKPEIEDVNNNENYLNEKKEIVKIPIMESSENFDNEDDNSVLKISNVMNENHLQPKNKVQTIISWITNKPSTTVLAYEEGRSNEKKEILVSQDLKTKHAVVLTTLTAGKTYYFSVKSVDGDGVIANSEEYALRTPRPQSTIIDKIAESFKTLFSQPKL
ncbi:MAG: hypothetical protein ACD_8C00082G0002 [uncultured bacterium]|nr:MAG: hypothetical protein ACD_8C00082G0002 [uncultured bacterium]